MRLPTRSFAAVLLAAGLAITGCGSDDEGASNADAGQSAVDDEPSGQEHGSHEDGDDTGGDDDAGGAAQEIEVEIEHGRVTPSGERVTVSVGQPVRMVIDSDAVDEIHVHAQPEHSFDVQAGKDDQIFEFTLETPGVYEAELHELGDVIVSIEVRP
ncbi:MAG: hypothetical protein GEU93_14140 [Propionibacteriales bacterium]|nr:hypothetical protein [Propionibacteriales bacterium]